MLGEAGQNPALVRNRGCGVVRRLARVGIPRGAQGVLIRRDRGRGSAEPPLRAPRVTVPGERDASMSKHTSRVAAVRRGRRCRSAALGVSGIAAASSPVTPRPSHRGATGLPQSAAAHRGSGVARVAGEQRMGYDVSSGSPDLSDTALTVLALGSGRRRARRATPCAHVPQGARQRVRHRRRPRRPRPARDAHPRRARAPREPDELRGDEPRHAASARPCAPLAPTPGCSASRTRPTTAPTARASRSPRSPPLA